VKRLSLIIHNIAAATFALAYLEAENSLLFANVSLSLSNTHHMRVFCGASGIKRHVNAFACGHKAIFARIARIPESARHGKSTTLARRRENLFGYKRAFQMIRIIQLSDIETTGTS
jgi:hypothetical protein